MVDPLLARSKSPLGVRRRTAGFLLVKPAILWGLPHGYSSSPALPGYPALRTQYAPEFGLPLRVPLLFLLVDWGPIWSL